MSDTYTTFKRGDVVRARMNTRYLTGGETYTVERFSPLTGEVTSRVYWVVDANGSLFSVRNGHINLEEVTA